MRGRGHSRGTLVNALLHRLGKLSAVGGALRPGIVHRLDRETSGAMVVARNDRAHEHLSEQFRSRNVQKIYVALVHGKMPRDSGTITLPISRDPRRRTRMTARASKGRHARTDWRVIARLDRCTLVEAVLHTGRTHQIRAHFAAIGHAVVGDTLYGAPRIFARRRAQLACSRAKFSACGSDRVFASIQRSLGGSSRSIAKGIASILRSGGSVSGLARRGDRSRARALRLTTMKKRAFWIAIVGIVTAVAAIGAQQAQPPAPPQSQPEAPPQTGREGAIVRNVNLVEVLFSVVTKRQKLITDMNKQDFKVFDDGTQQEITDFSQPYRSSVAHRDGPGHLEQHSRAIEIRAGRRHRFHL